MSSNLSNYVEYGGGDGRLWLRVALWLQAIVHERRHRLYAGCQ